MTEEQPTAAEPTQVIPADDNWVEGISSSQSVCEVASRVLDARLKAVCRWFPLAADDSTENIEYVHQLRLSVRRAVEAARIFSGLIEEAGYGSLDVRHFRAEKSSTRRR